jgi:hypothetical protein
MELQEVQRVMKKLLNVDTQSKQRLLLDKLLSSFRNWTVFLLGKLQDMS